MKLTVPQTLNGRHIFAAFLAFFLIVISVNLAMVYLALDSWSGLSTEDAYQRGLRYNRTLEAMAQRDALGWQEQLIFTPGAAVGGDASGRIELALKDRHGNPLEGLTVTGEIRRPTNEGYDRELELLPVSPGHYAADVVFPLRGNWLVRLNARHGPDPDSGAAPNPEHEGFVFGIQQRILVP